MILWRNNENDPLIMTKYPLNNLYLCIAKVHPHVELLECLPQFLLICDRPIHSGGGLVLKVKEVTEDHVLTHQHFRSPFYLVYNINRLL